MESCGIALLMSFLLVDAPRGEEAPPGPKGNETPTRIRIGVPIDSRLASKDSGIPDKDFGRSFRLVAPRSGRVTVRMESRDFDAFLSVRDEGGTIVTEDEDSGPGDGAEASFESEGGKSYVILASARGDAFEGNFRIEALEGEPEKLTFAEDALRDVDWFKEVMRSQVPEGRKCQVLAYIGGRHRALGAPSEAIKAWEESLERDRKRGVRDHEGWLLRSMGDAFIDLGDFEMAISRFREALESFRHAKNPVDEGMTLANLGNAYMETGHPEKAIEHLEMALRIIREQGFVPGESIILGNLAGSYYMIGQPERSVRYLEQSLEIAQRRNDLEGVALAQANLGNCHADKGNLDSAIERYESAQRVFREINDFRARAIILANLASVHVQRGQPEIALKHCLEALQICEQAHIESSKGTVLSNLGACYNDLGQRERALEHYLKALAIYRETMSRADEALALWNIGKLRRDGGDDVAALEAWRNAHSIEKEILGRVASGLDQSALQSLGSQVLQRGFAEYLQLLTKLVRSANGKEEKDALSSEALGLVEALRARALAGLLKAGDFQDLLSPEGKVIWSQLRTLRKEHADSVRNTFENLPEDAGQRNATIGKLRKWCETREDEIASLERRLKAEEPRYAGLFSFGATLADLAGCVGPDELLVHYNFTGKQAVVLVWSQRKNLDLQVLDAGVEDLEARMDALLQEMRPRDAGLVSPSALKEKLKRLRTDLLEGLEERLEGARSILVVPDGRLHLFPFEMLVMDDGSYLVEKLEVRYAPSIGVLLALERGGEAAARARPLLVGDPEFGESRPEKDGPAIALRVRGGTGFRKLEHARTEVDRIAGLFEEKTVLRGAQATEARFKEEAPRATLLHVVTHGKYEEVGEGNALFYSGLAFAGLNRGGDGKEDGFLTAAEVMALDLRAVDLAVLSACDTAAGSLQAHEGKFGLERAFFVAGVKAFIGSLWRVDDGATTEFMARLYRRLLDGKTRAEALRLTKLDFIRGSRQSLAAPDTRGDRGIGLAPKSGGEWSHPYYWAPFVLSGSMFRAERNTFSDPK